MDVLDPPVFEISQKEAFRIIQNPYTSEAGLYWHKDGNKYIGIDNSTHDAWVEEFDTKYKCICWLKRINFNSSNEV